MEIVKPYTPGTPFLTRDGRLFALPINCNLHILAENMGDHFVGVYLMTFGEKLRALRLQRKLNQRKLADVVGIDFTYLSKIETGKMPPPSQETIKRLAGALGADADELLLLADKVPEDVKDVITESPELPAFLRQIRGLPHEDLEKLKRYAERLKAKRSE